MRYKGKKNYESFKNMCLKENKDIYAKSKFAEEFAWQVTNIEIFDKPIKAKGQLGLWEYEGEIDI